MSDGQVPEVIYVIPEVAGEFITPANFYRRFDEASFINKVRALQLGLSEAGLEQLAAADGDAGHTPEFRKALVDGLRSEIHFTLIHNIETLIYLMLAWFHYKTAPPAIFMAQAEFASTYVQQLMDGQYSELSLGEAADKEAFYRTALFAGLTAPDSPQEVLLADSIELIEQCCRIYVVARDAYNAYKHGMRMNLGATSLDIAAADGSADPEYYSAVDSADSSQFMINAAGRKRKGNRDAASGPEVAPWTMTTHFYEPETAVAIVQLLRHITGNLCRSRLYVLGVTPSVKLSIPDRNLFQHVKTRGARIGTMRFNAGDQFLSDLRQGKADPQG